MAAPKPDSGPLVTGGPVRFLVDDHLRRLARWLRVAGCDAAWEPEIADRELYRRSYAEQRTILTRKKSLWAPRLLYLRSQDVKAQFRCVMETFGLDPYEFAFTRCVVCNVLHEAVAREDVAGVVPRNSYERHEHYRRCPGCGGVFWRGSHTERTLRFFEEATGRERPDRLR
jgi:uncharacterized protein with PIN domain